MNTTYSQDIKQKNLEGNEKISAADATNLKKAMLTYDSKFSMKIFRLIM